MKGKWLLILTIIFVIAGCSQLNDQPNNDSERAQVAEELDPTRYQETTVDEVLHKQLEYVKYTREQVEKEATREVRIEREKMADMITRIILQNKAFDEVATLVTDEDVLSAYQVNDKIDGDNAAEIARKSAMSVLPRYFEIIVSDNDVIMHDIQSLHNSTTKN